MISYGRQEILAEDIETVTSVLKSDFLTQGPMAPKFESSVADYVGAKHAVAVNSATSALHIACMALGLGEGNRLWTSPNTFVASANCGRFCGALVDFVDVETDTYNMSVSALAGKLRLAKERGELPKVVIPVHFAGQSCDMKGIAELGKEYGFRIIEDASHAVGGSYLGEKVGNCRYSDITVFSFHPVKIITTAEGGMALTNDAACAASMRRLRSHGVTRERADMTGESDGGWYYQQIELGYNYRMTELQAALGISQLRRVDQYVEKRHELARRYDEALRSLPVIVPYQAPCARSALHLYPIRVDHRRTKCTRREVYDAMIQAGVGVNVHYIPVHTQPYYQALGFRPGDFPNAERYYEEALSLPMYPALRKEDQDLVISVLREMLS